MTTLPKNRARNALSELRRIVAAFPIACKVYLFATTVFIVFNLGTILASETSAYRGWLELTQPLTDTVADYVPAVGSATAYLEKYRARLQQSDRLYWIPAVRNILSIDFTLIGFFSVCIAMAVSADLLVYPERAFRYISDPSNGDDHMYDHLGRRLLIVMTLLFVLVPLYFLGPLGLTDPRISSLTKSMNTYFILLGSGGLMILMLIHIGILFIAMKLGLFAECQDRSTLNG